MWRLFISPRARAPSQSQAQTDTLSLVLSVFSDIFQPLNVFLGSYCSMRDLSFVASDEDYVITTTSDDVDSDSYIRSSLSEESI